MEFTLSVEWFLGAAGVLTAYFIRVLYVIWRGGKDDRNKLHSKVDDKRTEIKAVKKIISDHLLVHDVIENDRKF